MLARRAAKRREVAGLLAFDPRLTPHDRVLSEELFEVLSEVNRGRLRARTKKIPVKSVHDESSNTANSATQTTPRKCQYCVHSSTPS